ncbi:MAG: hypothetical protein VW405_15805 [Rhodospirillaceae bacterium]
MNVPGAQWNAGRKPKSAEAKALGGHAGKRGAAAGVGLGPTERMPIASEPAEKPADLPASLEPLWSRLAPLAEKAGTLTAATVDAFVELLEQIRIRAALAAELERDGLTFEVVTVDGAGQEHRSIKCHPALGHHRAVSVRVEQGRQKFLLAPIGRPLLEPAPVEDPFTALLTGAPS